MKKIVLIVLILFLGIVIWYLFFSKSGASESEKKKIYLGGKQFIVEIADTKEKQGQGLSKRKNLAKDEGMIFIFPFSDRHSFWMKQMLIPLDFIWINGETVVDLTENVPPPKADTPDHQLQIYKPNYPADKVLEVNAGVIKSLEIKIDDIIRF